MKKPLVALLALSPLAAHAVVDTVSRVDPGRQDGLWSWVGQINGASAVAIGPRTVITANHVGAGGFTLGGVTYGMASSVGGPKISGKSVDLRVVQLTSDLPGWYSLGAAGKHSTVTMVGYGNGGVVNAKNSGYDLVGGGGRRSGDNTIAKRMTVKNYGPTLVSMLSRAGDSVLGNGDSGGGWFVDGQLVGISSFTFSTNTKKAAYGWAKSSYFGSAAIDLTDKSVKKWVASQILPATGVLGRAIPLALPRGGSSVTILGSNAQAVPEPGTWAALGLGLAAFLRRRRR